MKKLLTILMVPFGMLLANTAMAQCDAPTNLAASYSNNVSTFTWDAVPRAVDYHVQFKYPVYSWLDIEYETTVATNSLSLTGIIQSSTFDWRVNANCGSGISAYSQSLFTIPCPQPGTASTTNISPTSATLNWVAATGLNTNVSDFAIAYRLANTTNNWIPAGHTFNSTINITGLTPGTQYEWCVNQTCAYFNSTPLISQFTTLQSLCSAPAGLQASNIAATQATISWAAVSGAATYNVQYKPDNSNTWSAPVNTSSVSLLITGLNASTLYNWRVMTNCNGSTSSYATSQFTTATCQSYGANTAEWIDLFKLGTINRSSGAEAGGYVNTGISTNLTIGTTGNASRISAGFAGASRNQNYCVYIDFNHNGSFNDAGERVAGPSSINNAGNINFSIAIPATAMQGPAALRVVMRRNGSASISPCVTNGYGETEDYTVNLVVPTSANLMEEGAAEIPEKAITIGPNPSTGIFNISLPNTIVATGYDVLNAAGTLVQKGNIPNRNLFKINLTNMPAGLYMLRVKDQQGRQQIHKLQKH